MKPNAADLPKEWLEADGLGGFASGTVGGFRTRRYHAILLTARNPPSGRMVLVNGFEAFVTTSSGTFAISTQHYASGVYSPNGQHHLISFATEPWPVWRWQLPDGTVIEQELFVPHEQSLTAMSWKVVQNSAPVTLTIRLLLSGRDYHCLHHENSAFQFEAIERDHLVTFRAYPDIPAVTVCSNGKYQAQPVWYRQFLYSVERERGLDDTEDLASPGTFTWELDGDRPAVCMLAAEGFEADWHQKNADCKDIYGDFHSAELARRNQFPTSLHRAADAYLVRRGSGKTIIAGYPWFTDWGRDTFIAMRGLCLATQRLEDAGSLLSAWSEHVSQGMLPNRFPDFGDEPEFNSVDASLWFVIAVHDYLKVSHAQGFVVDPRQQEKLQQAVNAIVEGYAKGTRFGIQCDIDGLLAAGIPGSQLTWMDVKIKDWVVTPRIGKPVEIQALWLNALAIAAVTEPKWRELFEQGQRSFLRRFWNTASGCLFDVIDVDHTAGAVDISVRPNQILAVGGLPVPLIVGERARQIVDKVEAKLLTPLGLRTLSPTAPDYVPRYLGGVQKRDAAYHQGTVWPWLLGPFVDAWVSVRGRTPEVLRTARERFLAPLHAHLQQAGLGHVSELTDGESPFVPRGCPFQAWSMGELLRLEYQVLKEKRSVAEIEEEDLS